MSLKASSDGWWTRLFVLIPVGSSLFRLLIGLWKHVKDAFFGDFTTNSLEDNCKCLQVKMHEIRNRVDSLERHTVLDIHSTTHRLETGVAKMNLVQTSTLSEIKTVSSTSRSIATGINEINALQDHFHSEYTVKLNGIKAGVDAQNGLVSMLEEQLHKVDCMRTKINTSARTLISVRAQFRIEAQELRNSKIKTGDHQKTSKLKTQRHVQRATYVSRSRHTQCVWRSRACLQTRAVFGTIILRPSPVDFPARRVPGLIRNGRLSSAAG